MIQHGHHQPQRKQIWLYLEVASLLLLICVIGGIMAGVALARPSVYPAQQVDVPNAPAATSAVTATPTACVPEWNVVPSVDPGTTFNSLLGMAAVSASDVWAVGNYVNDVSTDYDTLAEHWNGTAWSVVPTPNQTTYNRLESVTAIAANDVWAVGLSTDDPYSYTLIEHWDGTAWSIVSSPNQNPYDELNSVAGTSSSDVWAVGEYRTNSVVNQTLVEHWNGAAWSIVPSPNQGTSDNYLYGVAATSAVDAWAVGKYSAGGLDNSLIEHWNGSSWTIVSNPDPASSELKGVVALAANDAWAVGDQMNDTTPETLVEHWNGSAWTVVSSPNDGPNDFLYAVDAISTNDIWAVGPGSQSSISEHWDGSVWTLVPTPYPDGYFGYLYAVTAASANDVWAAGGYSDNNNYDHTLVEHYSACNPTPSPTSTIGAPTSTPTATRTATQIATGTATFPAQSSATPVSSTSTATLTSTSVAETSTATPTVVSTVVSTPTTCSISFSDVPPGSTFYPYIRCLACLGIINGYSDGTFKPNNNVTRGQLSKIVSNSVGFDDPQPNQLFQDVPVGSTFQVYIGRLASRGYISGYPCGGVGEPCGPGNLPYFRPNNNATRGQISKIVSNAARFTDPPSGQQFQDVPSGSTYYTYTYRLVSRGVMSGYACGGLGEPCLPPGNLPYFRPNNNATRGQTSKIVSNTFFPDCNPRAH